MDNKILDQGISLIGSKPVRVLYSFPHKLGGSRISDTAWHQVNGLARAGADMLVFPGVLKKNVIEDVKVKTTLSLGKLRISYKLIGTMRSCKLHDYIVAKRIEKLSGKIDIIHTWALGSLQTLKTAARLGIPTVLERTNAHTRFGYDVVKNECERLGISLPSKQEHAYKSNVLYREEQEYKNAYRIICPSEFAVKSFLDKGFQKQKIIRHFYGVDENIFYPGNNYMTRKRNFTILFVGVCSVNKGLHYALEAWLKSSAHMNGTFLIAGEFLPAYAKKLSHMLAHPSVKVLGQRNDIPDLMRNSDVLVLPSLSEGFGLVCTEAMGCGCVPLVSNACTDICKHMDNSLVHSVGDVNTLTQHINILFENNGLLMKLRSASIRKIPEITWDAAGVNLLNVYRKVIKDYKS